MKQEVSGWITLLWAAHRSLNRLNVHICLIEKCFLCAMPSTLFVSTAGYCNISAWICKTLLHTAYCTGCNTCCWMATGHIHPWIHSLSKLLTLLRVADCWSLAHHRLGRRWSTFCTGCPRHHSGEAVNGGNMWKRTPRGVMLVMWAGGGKFKVKNVLS